MNTLRILDRRAVYYALAIMLVLVSVLPALVSAAQVTERSIELSSSSKAVTNVSYKVNFTAPATAAAIVIDFCENSPLIGTTCDAPAGFDVSGATVSAGTYTVGTLTTAANNKIQLNGAVAASTNTLTLAGVANPTASGPLYARIVTYDTTTNANGYTSTALGSGNVDQGGVAMSITDEIGVSAAVLESMTFCIAGATISENCDLTGNSAPVITLGETVGSSIALVPTAVSTGNIHTQISTNASGGAIVSLKSNATNCGGLLRAGAPSACDILPALATGIAASEAKFGVRTATATDTGADANGVFEPVSGSNYNNSTYALNYVSGNATGVTSTFGDAFLDTNDAPVNNKNMQLTFGASASNDTPAGQYSADLSLIATGKF